MTQQDFDVVASPATEPSVPAARPQWTAPAITSFAPVNEAQGFNFKPGDGVSNLT